MSNRRSRSDWVMGGLIFGLFAVVVALTIGANVLEPQEPTEIAAPVPATPVGVNLANMWTADQRETISGTALSAARSPTGTTSSKTRRTVYPSTMIAQVASIASIAAEMADLRRMAAKNVLEIPLEDNSRLSAEAPPSALFYARRAPAPRVAVTPTPAPPVAMAPAPPVLKTPKIPDTPPGSAATSPKDDDAAGAVLASVEIHTKPVEIHAKPVEIHAKPMIEIPRAVKKPVVARRPAAAFKKPASIFGSDASRRVEVASLGQGSRARGDRPDTIGWNNIEWGVTGARLKQLFGSALTPYEGDRSEMYPNDFWLRDIPLFTLKFDVVFQMRNAQKRLAQVLIDGVGVPERGDFETIHQRMTQIYGEPTSRTNYLTESSAYQDIDRTRNMYKKAIWKFAATTIDLTVMGGPEFFSGGNGWLYLRYFPSRPGNY